MQRKCYIMRCIPFQALLDSSVSEFLENRIEEIAQALRQNNGEYLLAAEKRKSLFMNIDPDH